MSEIIFTSPAKAPEIFIKLGEKCPTKCSGCFYGTIWNEDYDAQKIVHLIEYAHKVTSPNFVYFLYGVDTILHTNLNIYLEKITDIWRWVVLQINDVSFFEKEYLHTLHTLSKSYSNLYFLLSKNINSMKEFLEFLKIAKTLEQMGIESIRYDMSLDYEKLLPLIRNISWIEITQSADYFNYEFIFKNIRGSISSKVTNNIAQHSLDGCNFETCIYPDFFSLENGNVEMKDMIEFDIAWYIRIHHPVCFLSDIKISHIRHSWQEIFQHFVQSEHYFKKYSSGSMKKNCFECIQNWYSFEK